MVLYGARFLLDFFGPSMPYSMPDKNDAALDSEEFIQFLSLVTDWLWHSKVAHFGSLFWPTLGEADF
jgi:cardiolipin synthase A/B